MPIDVICPPSFPLIAWLRHVRVRRLDLQQTAVAPHSELPSLGFTGSEQRFRASVATLLATLDFIKLSAPCLR